MTIEANKALVLQYTKLFENIALADEILSPDFVDHSHPDFRPGSGDIKQNLIDFQHAFSDISNGVEEIIGEGDIVAFRFTIRGTHTGTYGGIPPTGKKIVLAGMDFVRVSDGKIVELWSNQDALGMLRQLGVIRFEIDRGDAMASSQ
jgi:steroid delta-isomerase-like uncharacterized protein